MTHRAFFSFRFQIGMFVAQGVRALFHKHSCPLLWICRHYQSSRASVPLAYEKAIGSACLSADVQVLYCVVFVVVMFIVSSRHSVYSCAPMRIDDC